MNSPPVITKRGGDLAATTPNCFELVVDDTPLVCAAQTVLDQRTPPQSVEAEQGVLGSMLQTHGGNEAIAKAMAKIGPEHFFVPAHRIIFIAVCDLYDAGHAIDLITFTQILRDKNLLESVGGAAFVTSLFTFVPTAAAIEYYLDIVRDKYMLREAIAAGTELVRQAYEEQDQPQTVFDVIESKLTSLRSLHGRNGHLPPMDDGAVLLSTAAVFPDDVVVDVLHRGAKMVLGGASKAFKTWAFIDLAVSVTTGTAWLGKFETKRGRVLYINLELQRAWFHKRLQTVCDERQLKIEPGYLKVWNLRGFATDLSNLRPRLLRGIGPDEFVLIIIDPIYKLLGKRDENKAGDIASLLNEIEALAVETAAAIAFGAHYSKGNQSGKEVIDRIGGSGVFARDPDSILNFTRHEEENSFCVDAVLRNHPQLPPFVVRWEFPLFVADNLLNPEHLKQAGGAPKRFKVEDFVALVEAPRRKSEIIDRARKKMKCSERTAKYLFAEAAAEGLLIEKEGEYVRPSENGADA